jgi:hypothetical protein
MDLEEVKKLIKDNLKIKVETRSKGSECSYYENTYVELIFMDEVISTTEIQKLSEDR